MIMSIVNREKKKFANIPEIGLAVAHPRSISENKKLQIILKNYNNIKYFYLFLHNHAQWDLPDCYFSHSRNSLIINIDIYSARRRQSLDIRFIIWEF
jgi:hypothetical protein